MRIERPGPDLVCWVVAVKEPERAELLDRRKQYTLPTHANIARDRIATSFDAMTRAAPANKSKTIADINRLAFRLLGSFSGTFIDIPPVRCGSSQTRVRLDPRSYLTKVRA
jgi:hypothetical protein